MAKQKYYVVYAGLEPGIYTSWEECRHLVEGVSGARFKSYASLDEAEQALTDYMSGAADAAHHVKRSSEERNAPSPAPAPQRGADDKAGGATQRPLPAAVSPDAIAVDAACSGNPGPMEYRGIYLRTGQEVFHYGPVHGTNNIGEFLAIVHALALIRQKQARLTIYTDSRNAMLWVKKRQCKTTLPRTPHTEPLFQLIERAERWLRTNDFSDIPILKWETKQWGEVPADFGRK